MPTGPPPGWARMRSHQPPSVASVDRVSRALSRTRQPAATVASAAQTALLATDAARGGKAYGRYLTQLLAEAADDAGAAQGTFDAIQPPDRRADELRGRLDELLTQASGALADLRIAARRGRFAELPELARPLE